MMMIFSLRSPLAIVALTVLALAMRPSFTLAAEKFVSEVQAKAAYAEACMANVLCARALFLNATLGPMKPEGKRARQGLIKLVSPFYPATVLTPDQERDDLVDKVGSKLNDFVNSVSVLGVPTFKDVPRDHSPVVSALIMFTREPKSDRDHLLGRIRSANGPAAILDAAASAANDALTGLIKNPERACAAAHRGEGPIVLMLRWQTDHQKVLDCLYRKLTFSLGLDNLISTDLIPSQLTRHQGGSHLFPVDRLLVRILFDDAIEQGMDEDAIKAIFADVYQRHRPPTPTLEPRDEAFTFDLLDPIDDATLACLSARGCALNAFLQMAVVGSEIEPRPPESQMIMKLVAPQFVTLVIGDDVNAEAASSFRDAYRYAFQFTEFLDIPIIEGAGLSPAMTNTHVLVSQDFARDETGVFEDLLEVDIHRELFDDAMASLKEGWADCVGHVQFVAFDYGLQRGLAAIPLGGVNGDETDDLDFRIRCVIEEFTQSLGLMSDVRLGVDTLYDDDVDNDRPTAFDLFMFKLLYHPAIEPQMDRDQVVAVFDQVYEDTWAWFEQSGLATASQ